MTTDASVRRAHTIIDGAEGLHQPTHDETALLDLVASVLSKNNVGIPEPVAVGNCKIAFESGSDVPGIHILVEYAVARFQRTSRDKYGIFAVNRGVKTWRQGC